MRTPPDMSVVAETLNPKLYMILSPASCGCWSSLRFMTMRIEGMAVDLLFRQSQCDCDLYSRFANPKRLPIWKAGIGLSPMASNLCPTSVMRILKEYPYLTIGKCS